MNDRFIGVFFAGLIEFFKRIKYLRRMKFLKASSGSMGYFIFCGRTRKSLSCEFWFSSPADCGRCEVFLPAGVLPVESPRAEGSLLAAEDHRNREEETLRHLRLDPAD